MTAFTNGSGDVLLKMTVEQAEVLAAVLEMAGSGVGCHRAAGLWAGRMGRELAHVMDTAYEETEQGEDALFMERPKKRRPR